MSTINIKNFTHNLFQNIKDKEKIFCHASDGRSLTYGQLQKHCRSFANELVQNYKVQPGQRVAIILEDTINWPVAFLSCILIGANPLLLYRNMLKKDVEYFSKLGDATYIIGANNLSGYQNIITESAIENAQGDFIDAYDWHDDELCWWSLSSGSVNKQKLIVQSHGSFQKLYNLANTRTGVKATDVILSAAKMSFPYGLAQLFWVLCNEATICLIKNAPAPSIIFNMIKKYKVTRLNVGSYVLNAMCKKNKMSLENIKVISSGEYLSQKLRTLAKEKLNTDIIDSYGASEVWTSISIQDNPTTHDMGPIFDGVDYKIINDQNQESTDVGELYIRHPVQAIMYWKNQKATNEAFIGNWFKTGDIIEIQNGKLIFRGRKDDVFKIKGTFVSPLDIEHEINSVPNVEQCVVRVDNNSQVFNLIALVKFKDENANNVSKLRNQLKNKLSSDRIPKFIQEVDELPRTINNKIKTNYSVDLKV